MKNAYDVVDQYLSSFGMYKKILETGWLIKDRNLFLTFLFAALLMYGPATQDGCSLVLCVSCLISACFTYTLCM